MPVIEIVKDLDRHALIVVTEYAASPAHLWQLWSDPRKLEKWWGPPGYPATVTRYELHPGGEVRYHMTSPEGERYHGGWRVLAVEPDAHLQVEDFFADAAAGTLPPVVFVDPNFLKTGDPEGEDEHPPSHLQVGQRFVAGVVRALTQSPQWKRAALFITYDEHGGLYDHMPPPRACPPDDKPPVQKDGTPAGGAFDTYGFRVPFMVVSPYARRGYVSHAVLDHTSILRFIQAKHGIPALTARDANADVPLDFFDFASPPDVSVPPLPEPTVDPGELSYCKATFKR